MARTTPIGARDIPVIVCVKDMPLGKLLRALADATHTHFTSGTREGTSEKTYRIYRGAREDAAIESFYQRRHEAILAQAKWQWNAMVAYGKSAELPGIDRKLWLVARLIASLGDDAVGKLMARGLSADYAWFVTAATDKD